MLRVAVAVRLFIRHATVNTVAPVVLTIVENSKNFLNIKTDSRSEALLQ